MVGVPPSRLEVDNLLDRSASKHLSSPSLPSDTKDHSSAGHSSDSPQTNDVPLGEQRRQEFVAGEFSMDDPRPMKVVVIGAGYSGIIAGIRFSQYVQNLDLTIYDANAGVGGTWFVNQYPGLTCDIPSHTYQLSFEDKTDWSSFYAPGPEILGYLQGVVEKYKLMRFIKLRHRIVRAQWDYDSGKWRLRIRKPVDPAAAYRKAAPNEAAVEEIFEYEEFEDTADVLFTGIGALNRWSWPDIEGLDSFEGKIMHSAQWEIPRGGSGWQDSVEGWGNKRIGVIGVGSSAIQVVSALQPKVGHLVNYVRGQTWLSPPFLSEMAAELAKGDQVDNYKYTDDDKKLFQDPVFYKEFRRRMESELNAAQMAVMIGSPIQKGAPAIFKEMMLKRLSRKPWIAEHLIPQFPVACRRLTPGIGYLEALTEDNVDFVPSPIKKVTKTGIETEDGDFQELDVIVCATGFDTSWHSEFPFIGRNGVDLRDKFKPYPRTYMSIAADGFPNWFSSYGPNAGVGAGSLLLVMEKQVEYAVQATLKLQRERLKSMDVKKEAVDDYDEYLDAFFPKARASRQPASMTMSLTLDGPDVDKGETGRIVALWPGSCLHAARALAQPRWEDYNFERLDKTSNRFFYLGDGLTKNEKDPAADRAWYLNEVDYPPGV
ncbi:hypothetical protein HGRIS_008568 [Hohenbuehelia grisea]|uniref:Flavin-containing monooxygenase n=1 Tax=Hohenbuehelia grisea TaxID=104357 RepID=A0ABR3J8U7_9AGAR